MTEKLTRAQIDALSAQVAAYRSLAANEPVSLALQERIFGSEHVHLDKESAKRIADSVGRIATPAKTGALDVIKSEDGHVVKMADGREIVIKPTPGGSAELPAQAPEDSEYTRALRSNYEQLLQELDGNRDDLVKSNGHYVLGQNGGPYSSVVPRDRVAEHITPGDTWSRASYLPSALPEGIDVAALKADRGRLIKARMTQRSEQLKSIPADSPNKLHALIELKALAIVEKQRAVREAVLRTYRDSSALSPLTTDRSRFIRAKPVFPRTAKALDQYERQQKLQRERRAKQKHTDQVQVLQAHQYRFLEAGRRDTLKAQRFTKLASRFHVEAEREEQKRLERMSKERIKALRNDDEEAYLKLIDTAKDSRIAHLLRQTDAFLDSLANAVQAQQKDGGQVVPVDNDTGPTDESRFGAQPVFEDADDRMDYYNVAHRVKETINEQPSILVGGELKNYQLRGLEWMISLYNNRVNGILADEMGLGKTIQTISLITYLIEKKHERGPFLVIVPLSTLPNWVSEFEKWAPSVRTVSYKGTPNQRKEVAHIIRSGDFQVLVTTYEYIIKDRPLLSKLRWVHMIIDEGHRMKNTNSKLALTLSTYYHTRYRLILTGTPLQNSLPELWALLNFVLPKIFNSAKSFDEWFNAPFANTGGQDKIEVNEEESLLVIRRLHKVLRPFLLRRLKKDVEADLPDKVERVIKCRMSPLQHRLTLQLRNNHQLVFDDPYSGAKQKSMGLKNQVMQLRKICNHPYTFDTVENVINPTGRTNSDIWRVSGKFELLDRVLPKLFAAGHRVLIFFQMTTVMTIFEDYLAYRGIKVLRLDGTTKQEDRAALLHAFNKPDSEFPIFALSTRAGGLGLNLQSADTVIIFDSDWNPHQDLQAQDRAHRIGQKKEVRILRLITENSIEEHVIAGAERKIDMDKKVIQAGRYDNKTSAEERDRYLRELIEASTQSAENPEEDDIDNEDLLNDNIARTEAEREMFAIMDQERKVAEDKYWVSTGGSLPVPSRLITESELPQSLLEDHVDVEEEEAAILPTGRRARQNVSYGDTLTDDQWLRSLEDPDGGASAPRGRGRPRRPLPTDDDSAVSSPKRQRTEEADDDDDEPADNVDDDEADEGTRAVQKSTRGRKPKVPEKERAQMTAIFKDALNAALQCQNEEYGYPSHALFLALPSRHDYPDYYLLIKRPISINQIKRQIPRYMSVADFYNDWQTMFTNAFTYNQEDSPVYKDAKQMKEAFDASFFEGLKGKSLPGQDKIPV